MNEPTYRQHILLKRIKKNGALKIYEEKNRTGEENYWQLVRMGYLKNLVILSGGWKFILTDKAEEYLNSFKKVL